MRALAGPSAPMAHHEDEPQTQVTPAERARAPAPGAPAPVGPPHLALGAGPAAGPPWSQKLEVLGRLAPRVAHDVNNQVQLLLGRTSLLLQRDDAAACRAEIEELHRAAERIGRLMRRLQTLSHREAQAPTSLDLNDLLAEMVTALEVAVGDGVTLRTDFQAAPAGVLADRGCLEDVVVNLVFNALDAMAGLGTLTLRTANAELQELTGEFLMPFTPGSYVLFTVEDTGCGMDRVTRAHIFEPYFTTKGRHGTGLGLATVWDVVREGGGTLDVLSAPGQGTVFNVYLPRARAEVIVPGGLASAPRPGKKTVLVVEDEDSVRALVREVISRQGYTVLEACDGRDALRLAESLAGRIDLLLTDCVLPHVAGGELARRLRTRFPALRVLYVSGYAPTDVALPGGADPDAPFLQKPFTPAMLTARVAELLSQ